MSPRKRILIIAGNLLFREGIKAIIGHNPGYEIVGEAGTGRQGLQMAKKLEPDLVLMDVRLPDVRGLVLIGDILKCARKTRVIVVSMHSNIDHIIKAFQSGAMGYLVKESAADLLLEGIEHVLMGHYYMDAPIFHQVVKKLTVLQKE
jgi:DNA-binding NarL/FixJ family response regulator